MTYQITTLNNGLRVASEKLPGVESVAITVSVDVGARYETEGNNGISHLLEHMAFKGTTTRSARDIAELFDNIGGQINAYTSMEHTVYYAKVLKENAALAVEILADIMQHSIFDATELKREKDVIIQEIAMHQDSPDDLIVDYFDAMAFKNQPLGRSILGTAPLITSFTREDLMGYMQTHYTPHNMVLTAAGNIDHYALVSWVETYFRLQETSPAPECERATYQGGDTRNERKLEQLHLIIGLPALTVHDPDYHTLQLYTNILGGGMSSRLFQEVREQRGLAYSVYASSSSYEDSGIMAIYAATAPEKGGELSDILCDEILSMASRVSDVELQRAKNQVKSDLLMTRENPQSIASWIGRHLLVHGRYKPASEIIERIHTVTVDDILRVAKKLASGKLTVAALGDVSGVLPYEQLSRKLAA